MNSLSPEGKERYKTIICEELWLKYYNMMLIRRWSASIFICSVCNLQKKRMNKSVCNADSIPKTEPFGP